MNFSYSTITKLICNLLSFFQHSTLLILQNKASPQEFIFSGKYKLNQYKDTSSSFTWSPPISRLPDLNFYTSRPLLKESYQEMLILKKSDHSYRNTLDILTAKIFKRELTLTLSFFSPKDQEPPCISLSGCFHQVLPRLQEAQEQLLRQ